MGLHIALYAVEFSEENLRKILDELYTNRARGKIEKLANESHLGLISALKSFNPTDFLKGFEPLINIRRVYNRPFRPYGTGFSIGGHPGSEIQIKMVEAKKHVENFFKNNSIEYLIID